MRNSVVFVALSALGLAAATQNFTIDPNNVSATLRANWCNAQANTCSTLCSGDLNANDCDPSTLNYTCLCSNGSAPGLEYYIQTMPTFICNEAFAECDKASTGSEAGHKNCTTSIKDECGTLDPSNFTAPAATSSAPSSTATAAPTTSAAAAATTTAATTSSKNAAPTAMAHYGNGVAAVAVGLLAYLL